MLVGRLDRLGGLLFVGGVIDLVLLEAGARSRESDRLSRAGPKGVLFVGDRGRPGSGSADTGVPTRGVESALPLCAFARAMFSIQLGCEFFVGDAGLGESGLASALSIQLDLFGLQRFDGLVGGEVAPSCSVLFVMYVEATDLLLLWWCDRLGLAKPPSVRCDPCRARSGKLLLLEVGRDDGSLLPSLLPAPMGSSFGMLYEPCNPA